MTGKKTALERFRHIARRAKAAGEGRRGTSRSAAATACNRLDDLTPSELNGVVGGNQPFTPHSIRGSGTYGVC